MTSNTNIKPATKRPRRMAREAEMEAATDVGQANAQADATIGDAAIRPETKAALVEGLLASSGGASLDELCQTTSWLPHTCRAFLTGLRKKGRTLERGKREDGTTIYKLVPSAATGVATDASAVAAA